jgi:two-component system sensor histidine kinase UhpB
VQITGVMLAVLGCVMLALVWHNPHEVYFGYFAGLCFGWAALSLRLWLRDLPWDHAATEYAFCIGLATLVALAVQFLLSYAGLRSRAIESALILQWLSMPLSLMLAGDTRLFAVANLWYGLFAAELFAVAGLYLGVTWRDRRHDFWPMAAVLGAAALLMLGELGAQNDLFAVLPYSLPVAPLPLLLPLLLLIVGWRLFVMFARALRTSEAGRTALARRVRELTTEFEGNFSQLAELRVEQVTERERKRIAADLHDDLGAKLLTIVHTSESDRITALAREALEDMRLSVKGLIGKPLRLADALADWRAETVARLSQSHIEVDWANPDEESEHLLPSRGFVQTTRILREAVSNIVKHSRATQCSVRCRIADGHFEVTIRDNGRGIPMELDGKLDRGLGMSSMKRRAKQMRGQCLVQSGPGYGTVIALTVPL